MSTLTPHGACLLWKPELIWINVVSDALLAVAFFVTAFVLGFFVWRRRRDVLFRGVFWIFAVFATFCALTRLLSILTLWVPVYDIESLVKGFLALVSLLVTAALLFLLPRILVLPTRVQLAHANAALEQEIENRRKAEAMVKRFQEIEANEAQVRQAQKMEAIGQLAGGVAHDFNNVLAVIQLQAGMMKEDAALTPLQSDMAGEIEKAALRAADLTRQLLLFSRRQTPRPRNVDLNELDRKSVV